MAAAKRKGGRGGARPGAGRPRAEHGERAVMRSGLRLYPHTWELLDRLTEATGQTQREVIEAALEAHARKVGVTP